MACVAVRSKALVLLLLIVYCCTHSVYAAVFSILASFAFILIDFPMACDCWCSVALPYCAMGWSAVCDSL